VSGTEHGDSLDLTIPIRPVDELVDQVAPAQVLASDTVFTGKVWSVVTESVALADGALVTRDVVRHPGAVAVMALDDAQRLVLVQQYRHPVGARLWEAPAGLCDEAGEARHVAAARELAEEAGLAARDWHILLDLALTPGGSDERIRIFLARGLSSAPVPQGFVATGEEADMLLGRFDLDQVVVAVLEGRVGNAVLAAGALAVASSRDRGWSGLRPADLA